VAARWQRIAVEYNNKMLSEMYKILPKPNKIPCHHGGGAYSRAMLKLQQISTPQ
jgi:hypothetical protein